MREKVICNNCGIKWVRITNPPISDGVEIETDLQPNCPKCGSNDYKYQSEGK